MSPVLTVEAVNPRLARFESWLAREQWTLDEATALLTGFYPDEARHLEWVPNGLPRAWQSRSDIFLGALQLRQSLDNDLRGVACGKELEGMPPAQWIELTLEVRRFPPQWLEYTLRTPQLARHLSSSLAWLHQNQRYNSNGRRASGVSPEGNGTVPLSRANGSRRRRTGGEFPTAILPLERGTLHEWNYLSPQSVRQIFEDVGWPLVIAEEDHEILCLVLREITFDLVANSFGRRPSASEVRRFKKIFEKFGAEIEALNDLRYPPPFPLREFRPLLLQWLGQEEMALGLRRKGGQPIHRWDRYAYPQLLGFYELAFGMPAASTNPGPTSRFITSYLTKVHDALAGSRFRNPKERNGVLDAWRVPRAPGLQSKIRNAAANGVAEMLFLRHKNARNGGAIAETKAN